jgi:hypothetical protein
VGAPPSRAQHHASVDALLQAQEEVRAAVGLDLRLPWLSLDEGCQGWLRYRVAASFGCDALPRVKEKGVASAAHVAARSAAQCMGGCVCDGVVTGAGGEPVRAAAGGEAQTSPQRESDCVVCQAQCGHYWHGGEPGTAQTT